MKRPGLVALGVLMLLSQAALAQYGGSRSDDVWVRMVKNVNDGGHTVVTLDSRLRNMEMTTYDQHDRRQMRTLYKLDRYDRPEEFIIYNQEDEPMIHGTFQYDLSGNLVEEVLYRLPEKVVIRRLQQDYDLNGNQLPARVQEYNGGVPSNIMNVIKPDMSMFDQQQAALSGNPAPGSVTPDQQAASKEEKGGLLRLFKFGRKKDR